MKLNVNLKELDFENLGYVVLNDEGNIVDVNKRALKICDYSKEEVLNKKFIRFIEMSCLDEVSYRFAKRVVDESINKKYTSKLLCKNNRVIDVELSVSMIKNNFRVVFINDITKEIEEKQHYKELATRYKSLFKNNSSVMLIINPKTGKIIDANEKAVVFYGYNYETLTSKYIQEINILDEKEVINEMEDAKNKKRDYFNFKHKLADNSLKDVEVYSGPINIDGQELLYSIIHDISEKKSIENTLEAEKKYTDTLINTANAIIVTTDKDYKTTSINNYFEFLTGFKKEEVIGKDTIELMSGKEYKKNIYNILKNIFEGKNNDVYSESSLLTKDGEEKLIAWKDSLVVTGEMEPVIISIGIDITEKKKSEKKIKRNLELESSLNEIRNIIEFRDFDKFKSIAEILFSTINIDRFEIIEYETKLNNFHRDIYEYSKDGKTSLKKEIVSSTSESISWVKNTLLKNNTIEVLNVSKLDSSFKIKDFLLRNNIRSFITISLIIKNELYAAITFNLFDNNDKDWLECDIEYIKKVGIILKNELRNIIQFKKVEKTLNDTVNTLSSVVQMRDAYTSSHQMRVSNLAVSIAKKMNLSDEKIKNIEVASKLHDIGKINIPGEILSKPGKINDLEFSLIKEHCKYGYNILQKIDFEGPIAEIVYQHHERIDGSGYPRGLKNKEILLESKIIAVSDVVEAMMSHRPYRKALGIKKALKEIDEFSGIKFDKDVVDACLDLFNNDNYNLPKINGDFN